MKNFLENNKKRIKFITTVGDKENIIRELEERVEEPTVLENSAQLKKELETFKNDFNDTNYNLSDDFSKYLKNKTGKYLVVCMNTAHMYQMIRKTHEMFDKVNPNVKVSYTGSRMIDSAKEDMFRRFDEQDTDKTSLNLLFLNKATTRHYNVYDADGVILLCYAKYHTKRNSAIANEALKSCKDGGVVIQVVDSIETISKYDTLQKNIKENDKYHVDFESSKSCIAAENFRVSTYSRKLDDRIKLEYFREYKKETGKNVAIGTSYKGHNIGNWKSNLRQSDLNGYLDIDEELRKEFEKEGILGERLRRGKTTDEEKFDLLLKFYKNNPNTEIATDTCDENGNPLGDYKYWLQKKVNQKTTDLSKKQITILTELGILNLTPSEVKQLSEDYKISKTDVVTIIKEHKNIKRFILKYKTKKIDSGKMKLNKRGIILSHNELSMKQKQAYITLLEDMYGENILDDTSKFIYEEDILNAIEKLSDIRKQLIIERYGLDGQEPKKLKEIGGGLINSRQHAKNLSVTALKKLSKDIPIYSIKEIKHSRDKVSKEIKNIRRMSYEEWRLKKISTDISVLGLNENITERLNKNGYSKMKDLIRKTEDELLQIQGIGIIKVKEIVQKTKEYDANIIQSKKREETKKLENELENLHAIIKHYGNAYSYYINQEDIFNQDGIIPASIIVENSSTLNSKLSNKIEKKEKLEELNTQAKIQEEKSEKLQAILEIDASEEMINKEEN